MKIELPVQDAVKFYQIFRTGELGTLSEELKNITSIHFRDIHAPGVDLRGENLSEADFTRAQLQDANLNGGVFKGTNFSAANLTDASLFGADLLDANFRDAILYGADLRESNIRGVDLRGTTLDGARLNEAIYDLKTKWPTSFDFRSSGAIPVWQKEGQNIWNDFVVRIENLPRWKLSNDATTTTLSQMPTRKAQIKMTGWAIATVAIILCVVFITFVAGSLPRNEPAQTGNPPVADVTTGQVGVVTVLPSPTPDSAQRISQTVPPDTGTFACDSYSSQPGVLLYSEINFEGACVHLVEGEVELENTAIGDNNVSSVRIVGNYKLTLFVDSGFAGSPDEIRHDEANLDDDSLGGRYSAARVEELTSCADISSPGLYLYSERAYEGNCMYVTSDISDLADTILGDNGPRSLRIIGDFVVTMHEDVGWGGRHDEFSEDQNDLTWRSLGDQYSSVRIRGNTSTQ